MICDKCGGTMTVIDTRDNGRDVRRRRKCDVCGQRFSTVEVRTEEGTRRVKNEKAEGEGHDGKIDMKDYMRGGMP